MPGSNSEKRRIKTKEPTTMKLKTLLTTAATAAVVVQSAFAVPNLPEFQTKEQLQALRAKQVADANPPQSSLSTFYTGKLSDSETGRYLFMFRIYDTELGSWTSIDPSGFKDGPNLHRYVPVPTTQFDAYGLWSSADYAWHYFWGKAPYSKGEAVDLSVTQDLAAVRAFSNSYPSGPMAFQNSISMMLGGFLTDRFTGYNAGMQQTTVNIDYESVVFSLGNSDLRMTSSYAYTGQYDSDGGYSWQYSASFTYYIADMFVDALDPKDWLPGDTDHPFGQPFAINGQWQGSSLQSGGYYE